MIVLEADDDIEIIESGRSCVEKTVDHVMGSGLDEERWPDMSSLRQVDAMVKSEGESEDKFRDDEVTVICRHSSNAVVLPFSL